MDEADPRAMGLFFEVFESLPRQGPGNRACARRALDLCRDLPSSPRVLDLGCGTGAQTLHLAEWTSGSILAIDSHPPFVARLQATLAAGGLSPRVEAMVGNMDRLELPAGSFDLVWSEGAFYNIGIDKALGICQGLLRPGGHVAFTDAVWRKEDPPEQVEASFADYPGMGRAEDVLARIEKGGFTLLGHFTLPDEAWWDDFYTPMTRRIEALRQKYAGDEEALGVLDELAREPRMHREYGEWYGYEFFVARRRV